MNVTISTSAALIVAVVGALVYAAGGRVPRLAELGRLAFAVGLLALLMRVR